MALHPGEAGYEDRGHRKSDLDEKHTLWDGDVERRILATVDSPSAADKLEIKRKADALEKEKKQLEFAQEFHELDWKKLPPYLMARLLVKIPRKGKTGEPDWYMSYDQALVYAIRCFELDLSPLSDDVYPMRDTWKTGITTSGKRSRARKEGLNLSPPQFKRHTRPWPKGKPSPGLTEDVGYECRMVVNNDKESPANYIAWISEWSTSSGVWRDKPEHMAMVRAYEKCLTFASGSGISSMPDDAEIEAEIEEVVTAEQVKVKSA